MTTYKFQYSGKSLAEIKKENPKLFYDQNWYEKYDWFIEKLEPAKYEIKLEPELNNLTYQEQKAKLEEGFDFIHPAILAEFLIEHYKKTGKKLMENWYSRCSVVYSNGNYVHVGDFDSKGLNVDHYYEGYCNNINGILDYCSLGISSSKKLKSLKSKYKERWINNPSPIDNLEILKKLQEAKSLLTDIENLIVK
jgi:hypothetical protein